MNLIEIKTGERGFPVVSARALYDFLGFANSQWSRWSKKNIVSNPYAKQDEDWEELDIMSSATNKATIKDYAIGLDFAKRLSMLAPTEKGEEIRAYFLACEKQALASIVAESSLPMSVEQVLLQQAHTLLEHEQIIDRLLTKVNKLLPGKRLARTSDLKAPHLKAPHLRETHLSGSSKRPVSELRQLINRKVNEYCDYHDAEQSDTYTYLYRRLNDLYRINVYQMIRNDGDTLIDALERYDHLDKVYRLVVNELIYQAD